MIEAIFSKVIQSKPKGLYISTDFSILTEFNGGDNKMTTITVSLPDEFEKAKRKFPEVDWNEVIKQGILKRLDELKKFEELKKRGEL